MKQGMQRERATLQQMLQVKKALEVICSCTNMLCLFLLSFQAHLSSIQSPLENKRQHVGA